MWWSQHWDNRSSSRAAWGAGTLTHRGPGAVGRAGSLLRRKEGEAQQLPAGRKRTICAQKVAGSLGVGCLWLGTWVSMIYALSGA